VSATAMFYTTTVRNDLGPRSRDYPGARSSGLPDVGRPAARPEPRSEAALDEALAASFPASDPPSWNPGTARPGQRR
jgi:hypothetical protein